MYRYHHVLNVTFGVYYEIMQLFLGKLDARSGFSCDVYFVITSFVRARWGIAIDIGKRRRKVDGRIRGCFNQADVLSCASTDYEVQRAFKLQDVDMALKLAVISTLITLRTRGFRRLTI